MAEAPWPILAATLLALSLPAAAAGGAPSTPPIPPPPVLPRPAGTDAGAVALQGLSLRLNGREQQAAWLWQIDGVGGEEKVWLPLEVLLGQLGFHSQSRADGAVELEWYGSTLPLTAARQRTLADELAVEVAPLLRRAGVRIAASAGTLSLDLPPPRLRQLRRSPPGQPLRLVLDLAAPALVRRDGGGLILELRSDADQEQRLRILGLAAQRRQGSLRLPLPSDEGSSRVFTLGAPARVVIDLASATTGPVDAGEGDGEAVPPRDPRLQALLGRSLAWDRRVVALEGRRFRLNSVSLEPGSTPLELRPLRTGESMEGLSLLPQLARRWDALVAINGGFFNRVRRLPLGALRDQGRWLSGPILNRGAVGWEPGQLPRFGRLQLQESLRDDQGERWPVAVLNSGYVQAGLSRYTADWGPWYRALSGQESAVLMRDGTVVERLDGERLAAGTPLRQGDMLVVGRGGTLPPWREGERLLLESRPSDPLGEASSVIGGGPLLLRDGQVVLHGASEGFGSAFLAQGAPRSVIASDGQRLLLLTLQGIDQEGPTLAETAALLQRLGVRDALNLDGGSSTGLVIGGAQTVMGRGVTAAIHNGLGLVPRRAGVVRPQPPGPSGAGPLLGREGS